MSSLKEVSVEIKGCPHTFSRRIERNDIPYRKDYIPFVVMLGSGSKQPEILFNQDDEMLRRLEGEHSQEILATGKAFTHRVDMTIDRIELSSQLNSTSLEKKKWLEAILERINLTVLNKRVLLIANQKDLYVCNRLSNSHLEYPKPEIFPVFPNA